MTNENKPDNDKPTRREFLARSAGITAGLVGTLGVVRSS